MGMTRAGWLALGGLMVGCGLFDFTEPTSGPSFTAGGGGAIEGGRDADGGELAESRGGEPQVGGASNGGTTSLAGTPAGGTVNAPVAGAEGKAGTGASAGASGGGDAGEGSVAGGAGAPATYDCGHPAPFPSTSLLDDFERPGPSLGSSWALPNVPTDTFAIIGGGVVIGNAGVNDVVEWNVPKAGFGAAQEVWATLSNLDPSSYGVELWMKDGFVAVGYYPQNQRLFITYISYAGNPDLVFRENVKLPTDRSVVLGGRAYPDGCVELFLDGKLEMFGNLTQGSPPADPSDYQRSGRIGIASTGDVRFEDFGGGTLKP